MNGGRARGLLYGLGALLCALTLVAAFVLAAVARAPQEHVTAEDEVFEGLRDPGDPADPGVRSLPLLDPAGPVVTAFPGGAGLNDPAQVRGVIDLLAERLGMLPIMDELLATPLGDPSEEEDLDLYRAYPYAYPDIDSIVDVWLTPESVAADPTAVRDLAGLLLLDAVRSQREDGINSNVSSWAGVAYSLLRRADQVAPSCDTSLDLLFVMSMGFAPHIEDVEAEAERAAAACPDDPTPVWLLGQVQSAQASLVQSFFRFERGPRAMAAAAESTFGRLRRDFPDSPLGWAGAADLHLQLAEEAEQLGTEPFQVRAWHRDALELYAEARRRSADPALLAGFGHALSVNGRHDEAVQALTDLQELLPGEPAYQVLLLDALGRAGRPDEVVAAVEATLATDRPLMVSLSLSPRRAGSELPASAAFGFGGSRAGSVFDQSQKYDGGSSVSDFGFVPVSNGVWASSWCRAGTYLSALIQAGEPDRAWELVRAGLDPESWDGVVDCHGRPLARPGVEPDPSTGLKDEDTAVGRLGMVAALETGDPAVRAEALSRVTDEFTTPEALLSEAYDGQVDFWRAVGDPERAAEVAEAWAEELPQDPWAHHRAGELAFLAGEQGTARDHYLRADEAFRAALEGGASWGDHGFGLPQLVEADGLAATLLELGAALETDGREAEARATYLRALDALAELEFSDYGRELTFYTRSQLGSLALATGDLEEAAQQLEAALEPEYAVDGPPGRDAEVGWGRAVRFSRGAQDNNLALALARLGRDEDSLVYAESALAHDRVNPIYVDTVAFVQHLAGDDEAAADGYRAALDADPTSYVSANNLAVLLAQDGRREQAAALLRDTVRVAPDYAIGWHNLGVVDGTASGDLLTSQGAHVVAARLDRDLRGRDDLVVDTEIYKSGLDVSRPVPPDWTYAASATEYRDRLTLSLLLLMLLRALWGFGLDKVVAWVGQRLHSRPGRRWPAWMALVAGGLVIAVPLLRSGHSLLERTVLTSAGVAMLLLPFFVRGLARTRTSVAVGHYAWGPSLVVAAVGAPFGLVFAPYPVLDAPGPQMDSHPVVKRLRRLVPLVLLVVALCFVALATLHPAPLARTLSLSALTLLGCVVAPVPPLDGSHVKSRWAGLAMAVGLAAAAGLFALKWV